MSTSPVVKVTIQNTIISATSNVIAQVIEAHNTDKPISIRWMPVFHFILWSIISSPVNYLWQEQMEYLFPSTHLVPTDSAIAAASNNPSSLDEKAVLSEKSNTQPSTPPLTKPVLSKRNTLIKVAQEQTLSAALNTLAFSFFFGYIQSANSTSVHSSSNIPGSTEDWATAWQIAKQDFGGIMKAGWKMWPLVSVVNLGFVEDLQVRALIGSLAGLVWSVYLSLLSVGR